MGRRQKTIINESDHVDDDDEGGNISFPPLFSASVQSWESRFATPSKSGLVAKFINIFDFRCDDDMGECLCRISYEKNGFLFQDDYCFGIDDKQDEYLYSCAYNYCIGEEEQTEEEFLEYVSMIDMLDN